ncbi:transposase [Hyalangium minutum]|uniref:transposase n=1 Tax=Hyalangium minutum TaxID=394096 RepID=UPI003B836424
MKRPRSTRCRRLHLCLNAGYDCQQVRTWAARLGFTLQVRRRRPPARPPKGSRRKKTQCWVVERSHSFLHRFRPLLVRWERRDDAYLALLHLPWASSLGSTTSK